MAECLLFLFLKFFNRYNAFHCSKRVEKILEGTIVGYMHGYYCMVSVFIIFTLVARYLKTVDFY